MPRLRYLNDDMIAALQKQEQLVQAIQSNFFDTARLVEISRAKRPLHHQLQTNPGDHPHGASYYSAKTLRSQLTHLQQEIKQKQAKLTNARKLCKQEQNAKDELLKNILAEATKVALLADNMNTPLFASNGQLSTEYMIQPTPKFPSKLSNKPMNQIRTSLLCYQRHLLQQKRYNTNYILLFFLLAHILLSISIQDTVPTSATLRKKPLHSTLTFFSAHLYLLSVCMFYYFGSLSSLHRPKLDYINYKRQPPKKQEEKNTKQLTKIKCRYY